MNHQQQVGPAPAPVQPINGGCKIHGHSSIQNFLPEISMLKEVGLYWHFTALYKQLLNRNATQFSLIENLNKRY